MNHTKRLLRIAEKILADVHFSTQQEFDEYLKNHPNYREDTKFYVNGVQVKAPPREKKNDSEMTDEQKKLHQMAMSRDEGERMYAARNRKTHPKTLEKLSGDWNQYVIMEVAENPNTSPETLEKLSEDKDVNFRKGVARNPNTSLEILEKLSDDKDNIVRMIVARNPNTSLEILEKLSMDTYSNVRRNVAENPNSQNEMLDYIYDNTSDDVSEIPHERFWVIVHPNVGEETLKKALNNGGYYAEIAKKRLNGEKIPLLTDYLFSPEKNFDFTKYHSEYFDANNGRYLQDYDYDDYDDYEEDEIEDDYDNSYYR